MATGDKPEEQDTTETADVTEVATAPVVVAGYDQTTGAFAL